ncbi:MAG TPA: hypothetical protein PLL77_06540 [Pyrinomonadaceae bacterium]|nr:hypothetical protein [Pyrinomonadaceae bacterium]
MQRDDVFRPEARAVRPKTVFDRKTAERSFTGNLSDPLFTNRFPIPQLRLAAATAQGIFTGY